MARAGKAGSSSNPGAGLVQGKRAALLARWVDRIALKIRRPRAPSSAQLRLAQRNVFVLPTRAGIFYAGMLLAMLVTSINYGLSLGFMLTFLCGAIALVAILHTFRNLSGVLLRPGRADPVFAGGHAEVGLQLANPGRLERHAIRIEPGGVASTALVELPAGVEQLVSVAIPAPSRGLLPMPRLKIRTEFPLGLFTAWAYWQPAIRILVYPAPELSGPPLPAPTLATTGGESGGSGEEDVAAVRPYLPGDPPRRIAWRAVARSGTGELISKQMEAGGRGTLALDWTTLPAGMDAEARISRLTRWVLDAHAAGLRWSLRLPGRSIDPGDGPQHRGVCLEALALLEL